MTILIDDRAGSKELIKYAPLDEHGSLCRLESGDVCIVGNGPDGDMLVGVELKSISDLISSSNTGRLQGRQIPAMLNDYDSSWLLYYGEYRASPRDNLLQVRSGKSWKTYKLGKRRAPYGYLESLLLTLVAVGIQIKHVTTLREAALWIGVLGRWWDKPWDKHKSMRKFDESRGIPFMPGMSRAVRLRAGIAKEFPGIGFEIALEVAKHFGSIREMINADVDEWESIPRIGKVIAKSVQDLVK